MNQRALIKVTKALSDPTRFTILQAIATSEERCCGDLAEQFPITQATCSQHLKILSEAGLVSMRREGQFNYYRLVQARLDQYQEALRQAFASIQLTC